MPNYFSRLNLDGAGDAIPSSDGHSYYIGFCWRRTSIRTDISLSTRPGWTGWGLDIPTTIQELTEARAFGMVTPMAMASQGRVPYQAT